MTQRIADASDAELLRTLVASAEAFVARSLVALADSGREDTLRGVVRVVIDLAEPFTLTAFVDDDAIATAPGDATLGPTVAAVFQHGLATLSPKWQALVGDLLTTHRAMGRLVIVLGQDKPHIDGVLTTNGGDHHQLFMFTMAHGSEIVH